MKTENGIPIYTMGLQEEHPYRSMRFLKRCNTHVCNTHVGNTHVCNIHVCNTPLPHCHSHAHLESSGRLVLRCRLALSALSASRWAAFTRHQRSMHGWFLCPDPPNSTRWEQPLVLVLFVFFKFWALVWFSLVWFSLV